MLIRLESKRACQSLHVFVAGDVDVHFPPACAIEGMLALNELSRLVSDQIARSSRFSPYNVTLFAERSGTGGDSSQRSSRRTHRPPSLANSFNVVRPIPQ